MQYLFILKKFNRDEWHEKCKPLDCYCTKKRISEIFPYIATLNIINSKFIFRHDTVAENHFICHPEVSLCSCVKKLLTYDYTDDETVRKIKEQIFSF